MAVDGVTGLLAGVPFELRCDAPDLAGYARRHLATLVPVPPAGGVPSVRASLRWHEGQPPPTRPVPAGELAQMVRLDRDLYVGDRRLCWFRVDDLRDLYLQFEWCDGRLQVHGDFYYRLGNSRLSDTIRRVRQWRGRRRLRARRFPTLLAYLVYYPCWWWLEQMRDYHPIHAAGVTTNAGAVLLAGASGVGKSTLSVALALSAGTRLLSDSFVLHHGVELLPVREPVLLDRFSRDWIGRVGETLMRIEHPYGLGRTGYHLPAMRLADNGRAAVLVFPQRSSAVYVRPLTAEQAQQRLSAANLIINDLRRYFAFAAVLEQLVPAGLMARREAHLAQLAAAVPCYDFGVPAAASSASAVDEIRRLLPAVPLRPALRARP